MLSRSIGGGLFAGIERAIGGGIGIFLVETGRLGFAGTEDDAELFGELVVVSAVVDGRGGRLVVALEEVDELGELLLDLDLLHPYPQIVILIITQIVISVITTLPITGVADTRIINQMLPFSYPSIPPRIRR
jgi:hypothetical protein